MKKVNQKIIEKMKELRKKGLSYNKIGEKLNLDRKTVLYHLNREYRERCRKEYKKRYREKLKKDKKFREYHKKLLRKEYRTIMKLRKKYQEYDKIAREYRRNVKKIGYKKAYRILKEKLMKLREKYNIHFPMRV